jgi:sugar phosphate isomerase/epimerase
MVVPVRLACEEKKGSAVQLVLHSVSYAGFWPGQARLTLEEFIPRAAHLGFEGVMLVAKRPHLSILDFTPDAPERRRQVRRLAEASGVRVACLAGYTDFTAGIDRPEIPVWEMQVGYVAQLAQLASELDCPLIRIFTAYERPGVPHGTAWGRTVEALREAARLAAVYGVTLAVQNHHDLAVHHESMAQLLAEVDHPNCKAGFDAWAPALQGLRGPDLADAVRRMAPFIAQTIVADYQPRPRFAYRPGLVNYVPEPPLMVAVPTGEGIIDYPTFFDTLAEVGYDGPVAYEMCSPLRDGGSLETLDRYARRFLDAMASYRQRAPSSTGQAAPPVAAG